MSARQMALSSEVTAFCVSPLVSPAMPPSQSLIGSGRICACRATAPVSSASPPCFLIASCGSGLAVTVCSTLDSAVSATTAASSAGGWPSTSAMVLLSGLKCSATSVPVRSTSLAEPARGNSFAPVLTILPSLPSLPSSFERALGRRLVVGRRRLVGAGEVGLLDDRRQQPLQRGIGAGKVLQIFAGNVEVAQRRQPHVAQETVPLRDIVVVVELQNVLRQRRDRGLGILRAAAGKNRAVECRLGGDILDPVEDRVVETGIGEGAGNADAQRLVGAAGKHLGAVRAGEIGGDPLLQPGHRRIGQQLLVGARRQRNRAHRFQRFGDQRLVGRDVAVVDRHAADRGKLMLFRIGGREGRRRREFGQVVHPPVLRRNRDPSATGRSSCGRSSARRA